MQPTRRDICRAGVLGVAALGVGACDGASGPPVGAAGRQIPTAALDGAPYAFSLATFSAHIGSRFQLSDANGGKAPLTLVRATDLGIAGRPVFDKAECFALAFEADEGAVALAQDTYLTSHAALGSFPLFIVPGPRAEPGRQTYSALFNRI